MPERMRGSRRVRLLTLWIVTALLVGAYLALPSGDEGAPGDAAGAGAEAGEPHKLEIVNVSPAETPPGTTVIIRYRGADDGAELNAFAGKVALEVLARRPGSMVARLPADIAYGRAKLRIADGDQRSKPYDLRIKAQNWRKPFRGLIGGLALLAFGISVLARGIRETVGLGSARRLASLAHNAPAALGFGSVVGAIAQSTTAAAGLLAGLVTSSVIAVAPAAVAFLGAQLGAATAPLLITGVLDPREGMLAIAIGVIWLGLGVGSARGGGRSVRARRRPDRVRPPRAAPGVRAVRRRQHADPVHRRTSGRTPFAGSSPARCWARRWWRRSRGRRRWSSWCWGSRRRPATSTCARRWRS